MLEFEVFAEILLIVVAIIGMTIEWQIIRGNRLVSETKDSLNDMKRQQNQNAQVLNDKISNFLNDINKDIEKAADNNLQLSQNLRDSRVQINSVLKDMRQINLQLLARIEVLNKNVENGNGHTK